MQQQKQQLMDFSNAIFACFDKEQKIGFLEKWFKPHNSLQDIADTKRKIVNICKGDVKNKQDKIIKLLDQKRFYHSVHTLNQPLRERYQDALLTALFFPEHIAEQKNLLEKYQQHFKKQFSIYGRKLENLSDEDIKLAAKGALVNGKLIDRFGDRAIIDYGLSYLEQEIKALIEQKIAVGFLTLPVLEGYMEDLQLMKKESQDESIDSEVVFKKVRYFLETILNGAGITIQGEAKYKAHENLVQACYWLDELFKQMAGRFAVVI